MPFGLGAPELIIILVIIMVIFGGSQLPKLARSLGQAKNEFEKSSVESEKIKKDTDGNKAVDSASTANKQLNERTEPNRTPQAASQPAGDNVTLSRAELDALIAKAAENQRGTGGGTKP